jgi:NAD+ kinase
VVIEPPIRKIVIFTLRHRILMQVIIYSTVFKSKDAVYVQELFDELSRLEIGFSIYQPYYEQIKDQIKIRDTYGLVHTYEDIKQNKFDFVITLGGDGTILSVINLIQDSCIPIFGINLGRLGFLANVEKINIRNSLIALHNREVNIEERGMLYLESNLPMFDGQMTALNDFTILKRDTSSMITIHTFLNGAYLNTYWADGLIVATPTGSTGYSLSCGGPIIFPNSDNFVITPVAPHNLNVRPIIIPDTSVISFEIIGRAENFLSTLDSRFEMITQHHQLAIRKNNYKIRLVQLHGVNFLNVLRGKLAWGNDLRN